MVRIFISYSSKSKDTVSSLAQDIETTGHQIWFDHKLTGGQVWWDQILENIRQCDLFIFALTPDALDSYPCQLEYTYAHQLGKHILPVLVADGVSIGLLPSELTTIQFVDYRTPDRQAAFKLMSAFTNLPAPKPLPDPLPEPPPVPISYIGNLKEQIDSSKALSFDEQASLVLKLKEHLQDEDNRADAMTLFQRLKRRDDLFAKIEKEIDAVLASVGVSAALPKSPPKVSQPPPVINQQQAIPVQPRESGAKPQLSRWRLVQLIVIAGAVWGVTFLFLRSTRDDYWVNLVIVATAYFISGMLIGLVFWYIEPLPRSARTPRWIVNTLLMGGPLNALLLRRVMPTISWVWVIGAVVWWGVSLLIGVLVSYFFNVGTFDLRNTTTFGAFLWGAITGAVGAAILYFVLARASRSQ